MKEFSKRDEVKKIVNRMCGIPDDVPAQLLAMDFSEVETRIVKHLLELESDELGEYEKQCLNQYVLGVKQI